MDSADAKTESARIMAATIEAVQNSYDWSNSTGVDESCTDLANQPTGRVKVHNVSHVLSQPRAQALDDLRRIDAAWQAAGYTKSGPDSWDREWVNIYYQVPETPISLNGSVEPNGTFKIIIGTGCVENAEPSVGSGPSAQAAGAGLTVTDPGLEHIRDTLG